MAQLVHNPYAVPGTGYLSDQGFESPPEPPSPYLVPPYKSSCVEPRVSLTSPQPCAPEALRLSLFGGDIPLSNYTATPTKAATAVPLNPASHTPLPSIRQSRGNRVYPILQGIASTGPGTPGSAISTPAVVAGSIGTPAATGLLENGAAAVMVGSSGEKTAFVPLYSFHPGEVVELHPPCGHREHWRRLRVRKGLSQFVCCQCGARWKAPLFRDSIPDHPNLDQ